MKIIVTGATGFIGRAVVHALVDRGHTVLAVDRAGSAPAAARFIRADLADSAAIERLFAEEGGGAALIHLAWDMRRHEGFGVQAESVRIAAGIADVAAAAGVSRIVTLGSADEFGAASGILTEETTPVQPLSPYGWAKRAVHDLFASWAIRTGIPVVWLRPFIVYGPGQRGDQVIPYAVECARQRKPAAFSDGQQVRDFVYINDAAEAVCLAVEAPARGFEEYNLGSGQPTRVVDVLRAIAAYFQVEDLFKFGAHPRRPGEPDEFVADPRRAAERLGWRARTDWRSGIEQTCEREKRG
ncbi:MAG: NAD(P)-dependent oxidoreductase [Kiritimatiellae bacterium]|nr:NAD(P)-dependent oxidoreductase [Kiritimatiellia bacterium]MDW8459529.1 NAD(P)-dependent oxidoreductase [Verrucomicrobiota bacterium]